MLARARSRFLLSFFVAFSVAACLPAQAQINGVPASVTSYGFGGSNNPNPGVRASVTSLGPNGYGNSRPIFGSCCYNFFMPANPNPPLFSGRRHRHDDHSFSPIGISEPVYIPYAVPYAVEAADDSADDDEYVHAPRQRNPDTATKRTAAHDSAPKPDASSKSAPDEPEVVAQPSTVLVFKDGHQADVLNYAIVGDSLFDFAAGRTRKVLLADLNLPATRKANDDRGVDFQIPASAIPASTKGQ
jgi:hypothetical protein